MCAICGADLAQPDVGRPRRYCGAGCRRLAERRIRIAEQLLTRARKAEQDARLRVEIDDWDVLRKRLAFWAAEVARLDLELRDLLAGDAEDDQ